MDELLRQRSGELIIGVELRGLNGMLMNPQNSGKKGQRVIRLHNRFKIHIPFCVSFVEQRSVSILSLSFVAVNGILLDLAGRTSSFLDGR